MHSLRSVVVLSTLFFALASSTNATGIYNAAEQFDITNNPAANGVWSYAYSSSPLGSITLLPNTHSFPGELTGWAYSSSLPYPDVLKNLTGADVVHPAGGFFPKDALTIAPGQGLTEGQHAVVRWSAPASGMYSVSAEFIGTWDRSGSLGQVHIVANGVSVFSGEIDRRSSTYYTSTYGLVAGDTIDFVVGDTPGNEWVRSVLHATITAVPEPSTVMLMLLGAVAAIVRAARGRPVTVKPTEA